MISESRSDTGEYSQPKSTVITFGKMTPAYDPTSRRDVKVGKTGSQISVPYKVFSIPALAGDAIIQWMPARLLPDDSAIMPPPGVGTIYGERSLDIQRRAESDSFIFPLLLIRADDKALDILTNEASMPGVFNVRLHSKYMQNFLAAHLEEAIDKKGIATISAERWRVNNAPSNVPNLYPIFLKDSFLVNSLEIEFSTFPGFKVHSLYTPTVAIKKEVKLN